MRALMVLVIGLGVLMSSFGVQPAWADCSLTSVGLTPLNDLCPGAYQFPDGAVVTGGLYPNGADTPPAQHLADGLSLAQQVQSLDAVGNPDPAKNNPQTGGGAAAPPHCQSHARRR